MLTLFWVWSRSKFSFVWFAYSVCVGWGWGWGGGDYAICSVAFSVCSTIFFSQSLKPEVMSVVTVYQTSLVIIPSGSPSRGGNVTVYVWHKPAEFAHSCLSRSRVCFSLYGPFNCISSHEFSQQLSVFSLCSSGLISVLVVLSTIHLFMKVFFSPDIIPSGWLGSKHQLTN